MVRKLAIVAGLATLLGGYGIAHPGRDPFFSVHERAQARPSFCFPSALMRDGCQGGSHTTSTVTFGCPSATTFRLTSSGMLRAEGQACEVSVIRIAMAPSSI